MINWVGRLNFWASKPKLYIFPRDFESFFRYVTLSMLSLATKYRNSWISCAVNVKHTKSWQISKELPILRVYEKVSCLGLVRFAKKLHLNCLVLIMMVPNFPVGWLIYWVGSFWAMGRFNLLGGQSNLLGGQMPTQLTCYLPPCYTITNKQRQIKKCRNGATN